MNRLFWTGYCNLDRIFGITEVERIINYYGFIVDFKKFSDVAMSFTIELEEKKLSPLYANLTSLLKITEDAPTKSASTEERTVMLNVSFGHSKGNMKFEVPVG